MSFHNPSSSPIFYNNSVALQTQGYWQAIKDAYSISTDGLGGAGFTGFSLDTVRYVAPEVLAPPRNVMVSTPFLTNRAYDVRWDRSPNLYVLGYSVYRAYRQTGEFVRITDNTVHINQHRDTNVDSYTESLLIPRSDNTVPGWRIAPGDEYQIHVPNTPIVESGGFGKTTSNPNDVVVTIDGVQVIPSFVDGERGIITLNRSVYYDAVQNEFVTAKLPDLNSEIRVSYWYQKSFIDFNQTRLYPPYYKVTSVAFDMDTGDLIETDPNLIPSTTLHIEQIDWIWQEAIRRNAWIAEISGERVLAYQAKKSGVVCNCLYRNVGTFYPAADCEDCYGTGYIGGYEEPKPLIVVIPFAEKGFELQDRGMRRTDSFEGMWAPPDPMMEQFDLLLRQDGTLHQIGPVRRPNHRGYMALQQRFSTNILEFHHVQYKILQELDGFSRTLQKSDGVGTRMGSNHNTIHHLSDKSPEPTIHFRGNTYRYPTIAY